MSDDQTNTAAPPTPAPPNSAQSAVPNGVAARAQSKLRFDTSTVKSTYCNVCNATSTREEVVVNFGVNKTWDTGTADMEVQVEHRIILSPFAAKRLLELLTRLMGEHEQRYGELR